jgi:hypothetical protein
MKQIILQAISENRPEFIINKNYQGGLLYRYLICHLKHLLIRQDESIFILLFKIKCLFTGIYGKRLMGMDLNYLDLLAWLSNFFHKNWAMP